MLAARLKTPREDRLDEDLAGKTALVVGASDGVGRAYALGLAQAGVQVAAVARRVLPRGDNPASLKEVMEAGKGLGPPILGLGADISRKADIDRVVDETLAHFGHIDIFVYNATSAAFSKPLEVSDELWDKTLALSIHAPYAFFQRIVPGMMARRSGAIICLSTRASLAIPIEDPAHRGLLAYGVAKAGLNRICSYCSEELKPYGIAVNMLSPGNVNVLTGGKEPSVEQFAPPLLHLARQTAQTMTGQWRNTTDFGTAWP
jgi:NAD(P)-dependent dehydrogenase (short-subunit alcohol dehydrogenase family)